jgi:hypothetical protein
MILFARVDRRGGDRWKSLPSCSASCWYSYVTVSTGSLSTATPRVTLRLTYRDAIQRACSPQDVLEITKRAVADAKKGDAHARLFIARIMGLDSLRITVDPAAHPAPNPPVYHLDALDDDELAVLGRLSAKMLEGPGE